MNAQSRAFWKGSAITGTAVLLLSLLVIAATLTTRPSMATSDVHTPTSTVTATVPGPTITATVTAPATAPKSCRDALTAADRVISDNARNQATEGQALIDAGRTGDGSPLYAALTQMKARQSADNADLSAYAAAKNACNGGG